MLREFMEQMKELFEGIFMRIKSIKLAFHNFFHRLDLLFSCIFFIFVIAELILSRSFHALNNIFAIVCIAICVVLLTKYILFIPYDYIVSLQTLKRQSYERKHTNVEALKYYEKIIHHEKCKIDILKDFITLFGILSPFSTVLTIIFFALDKKQGDNNLKTLLTMLLAINIFLVVLLVYCFISKCTSRIRLHTYEEHVGYFRQILLSSSDDINTDTHDTSDHTSGHKDDPTNTHNK